MLCFILDIMHPPVTGKPTEPYLHGSQQFYELNGKRRAKFMLNTYTGGHVSDDRCCSYACDERICELSKELVPQITTVSSKKGVGGSAWNVSPKTVIADLKASVTEVLSGDIEAKLAACRVTLPEQFTYEVNYKDLKKAYQMSFYPGMKAVDARTNRLTSKNWMVL